MPLRRFAAVLLFALVALPGAALALGLEEAKDRGLVGERVDGYVGVVQAEAGVERLIARINEGRREKYREIASRNGTALEAVERIAGKKLLERAAPDTWIMTPEGRWVKKKNL